MRSEIVRYLVEKSYKAIDVAVRPPVDRISSSIRRSELEPDLTMLKYSALVLACLGIVSCATTKKPSCIVQQVFTVCHYKTVLVDVTETGHRERLEIANLDLLAIQEDAFKNLSVSRLELSEGNRISVVSRGSFRGLPKLTRLDLDNNVIPLTGNLFAELPKLNALSLMYNKIIGIPKMSFAGLSKLMFLYLSENDIASIEADSFEGLTTEENIYVYLDHNKISSIAPGAFEPLTKLTRLGLRDNQLATIERGAFRGLSKLEALYLERNRLTSLSRMDFHGLTELRRLHLNDNAIESIAPGAFHDLAKLDTLKLDGNRLTSLDAGIFDGLTELTTLALTQNQIATISDGVFAALPEINVLYITGNNVTVVQPSSGLRSGAMVADDEHL